MTGVMKPEQSYSPRDRMVYSAAQLVRERGVTATGVRDVVERAAAPRGSFQHYFPGGKDQLVSEAVSWAGKFAADWVERYLVTARNPTPSGLFAHMVGQWKREYTARGFARGCPLMATAADVAGTESVLNEPNDAALGHWEAALVAALAEIGVPTARGRRLATLMLSTLEGAIMMARVQGSVRPLNTVVAELGPLLDAALTEPGPDR
jgi:AcrR family transcriptional regulator